MLSVHQHDSPGTSPTHRGHESRVTELQEVMIPNRYMGVHSARPGPVKVLLNVSIMRKQLQLVLTLKLEGMHNGMGCTTGIYWAPGFKP